MRIDAVSVKGYNRANQNISSTDTLAAVTLSNDSYTKIQKNIFNDKFSYIEQGNVIKLVSFQGRARFDKYQDEEDLHPSLKMKVAAVSQFQDNIEEITYKDARRSEKLNFELDPKKKEIKLFFDKNQKPVGFIHYEILDYLYNEIEKNPKDFEMKLASVIRFPGINNVGLKARINYIGENKEKFKTLFEDITEDAECKGITYPPMNPESPEDILKTILKYEEMLHGSEAKNDMQKAVDTIANEIKKDSNKNILLLGHKDPDGDCIGSLLGMKNAIELMHKDKNVDCSVDDRIPSLFSYLKDINQIKNPNKSKLLNIVKSEINSVNPDEKDKLNVLESIKTDLTKNSHSLAQNKKYDLVILMDVAAPDRLGYSYAKYFGPETKVIFIDHHPKRTSEWMEKKSKTNIDIEKVKSDNLLWVADRVPAATEMVAVIAGKLNPKINSDDAKYAIKDKNILKNMAAAILTGVHTDTSGYNRSANLLSDDLSLPKYERPQYKPIGLAKWFSKITDRKITRNFIESSLDNQEYQIKELKDTIRTELPKRAFKNKDLQLGYVQIEKEFIDKLWMKAAEKTPNITSKDILGAIKYSSAFKAVKRAEGNKKDPAFVDDTIAYLMTQTAKKGEFDMSLRLANVNTISFSFRSKPGTNHAAILASLFGGGGHGAAAGGRLSGADTNFDSKLLVLLDSKVVSDPEIILKALTNNFNIEHTALPEIEKQKLLKKVQVVESPIAEAGKTAPELIEDIVGVIRKKQAEEKELSVSNSSNNPFAVV